MFRMMVGTQLRPPTQKITMNKHLQAILKTITSQMNQKIWWAACTTMTIQQMIKIIRNSLLFRWSRHMGRARALIGVTLPSQMLKGLIRIICKYTMISTLKRKESVRSIMLKHLKCLRWIQLIASSRTPSKHFWEMIWIRSQNSAK